MDWKSAAAHVAWNIRPFVDGKYGFSQSPEQIDNINPATEEAVCKLPAGSPSDVHEAVSVARRCFDSGCWSDTAPSNRGKVLERLAGLLVTHSTELALM